MKKWDNYFSSIAEATAQLSYATKLKVGAVAVSNRRIICQGYNGTPSGLSNICEIDGKTLPSVLHAEENLILFAAKKGIKLEDTTLYITHAPCINCARMIYGAGFKDVYFKDFYKSDEGIAFLISVNINIRKLT